MLASHRVKDCGSGAGVVLCEELPARARHQREEEEWGKKDKTGSVSGGRALNEDPASDQGPGKWAGVWEAAPSSGR